MKFKVNDIEYEHLEEFDQKTENVADLREYNWEFWFDNFYFDKEFYTKAYEYKYVVNAEEVLDCKVFKDKENGMFYLVKSDRQQWCD